MSIGSALLVVTARNPVHSVLFLILSLLQRRRGCSCCWALSSWRCCLVVVYVGAVAVLFLFVVMMLDVDFGSLRTGFARYLPIGGVVAAFLLAEMILVSGAVAT